VENVLKHSSYLDHDLLERAVRGLRTCPRVLATTPTPSPSPQGGGEQTECEARSVDNNNRHPFTLPRFTLLTPCVGVT